MIETRGGGDIEEMEFWKCPYCGHDKNWFDRSIDMWQDESGKWVESGPWFRCCKCGKADD